MPVPFGTNPYGNPYGGRIPRRARRYFGATGDTQQEGSIASFIGPINYMVGTQNQEDEKQRRAEALVRAYKAGTIDIDKLGPSDTKLFASYSSDQISQLEQRVDSGGVPGFFENLGEDISTAAKGLPQGVAQTSSSVFYDLFHKGPALGGESKTYHNVVLPTVDQYKYTYLGKGAPEGSTLWSRIYDNPLGPLLDIGAIGTGGAGLAARTGGALARRGLISPESALARMGRTDTRPPIALSPDLVSRRPDLEPGSIDRYYGRSPLRKGLQILTDTMGEHFDRVHGYQESSALRRQARESSMNKEALASTQIRKNVGPLIESRKNLTPQETTALDIIARVGAGEQAIPYMDAWEKMVGKSLAGENEPGANFSDYAGSVERQYAERGALIPDDVRSLVRDPSQSPNLTRALDETRRQSELTKTRMDIPDEEWQARVNRSRSILEGYMDDRPPESGPEGPLPPEGGPPPQPEFDPNLPEDSLWNVKPEEPVPEMGSTPQTKFEAALEGDPTSIQNIPAIVQHLQDHFDSPREFQNMETIEQASALDMIWERMNPDHYNELWGETGDWGSAELAEQTSFDVARRLEQHGFPDWGSFLEAVAREYHDRAQNPTSAPEGFLEGLAPQPPSDIVPDIIALHDVYPEGGLPQDFDELLEWVDIDPEDLTDEHYAYGRKLFDLGLTDSTLIAKYDPNGMVSLPSDEPSPVDWANFDQELQDMGINLPNESGVFSVPDTVQEFLDLMNKGQTRDMLGEEGIKPEPDQGTTPEDLFNENYGDQFQGDPSTPEDVHNELADTTDETHTPATEEEIQQRSEEIDQNLELSDEANAILERDPEAEGPDIPDDGTGEPVGPDHVGPMYTPDEAGRGFKATSRMGRFMRGDKAPEFSRNRSDVRKMNLSSTTYSNVLKSQRGDILDDPQAFISGVARNDARAFVDHVAQRERLLVNNVFSEKWLDRFALKGEDGEMITAMSQNEVRDRYGEDWALVHPKFPIQWYKREIDISKQIKDYAEANSIDAADENAVRDLDELLHSAAQDAVSEDVLAARKLPGVVVPRSALEYQLKIARAADPFAWTVGAFYARAMHRWRTMTLAYMPRWALNTAIGSFVLSLVKGVGPRDFYRARQWRKEGLFDKPDDFPELAGIELNHLIGFETLEPFAQGRVSANVGVDSGPTTRWIIERVQAIEDYFRRASFVHSLRRESQDSMAEVGDILIGHEHLRGSLNDTEYRDQLLSDPKLMERTLRDVNRFSYNFAVMGPFERRYVRQFVPFWGWYKFVSKLAWSLPVDNPIKANLMYNLGELGAKSEEDLGIVPEWIRGALILNKDDTKNLKYLSTLGMNPFAQFINPFGPMGTIQGTVSASQGAPAVQAFLSALGVDTLRGGTASISPQEGIGTDFFGSWIDTKTGRETDPRAEAAGRRLLGSLMRSVPQVRMLERGLAGGRNVYPESIPVFAERPMATKEESRRTGALNAALEMIGVFPRRYDLDSYQRLLKKRVKYAKTRNKGELRNLLENLGK